MTKTLYVIGAMLMAIPALLKTETRFWFMGCMAVGCVLIIIATVKLKVTKPKKALLLLVISSLTFWLSFVLWLIRDRLFGPLQPFSGEDPFGLQLALWSVVLIPLVIYEVAVFLWGVIANRERRLAAIGLVAVAAQAVPIFSYIYLWAQAT